MNDPDRPADHEPHGQVLSPEFQGHQLISPLFGDVYYSHPDGLAESRHVFLQHNLLAERWPRLRPGQHFVIAETGFGTGLNFLAAWQLWRAVAAPSARLHFISTEKYPLMPDVMARALACWPELATLAGELLAQYQALSPGWHRLSFEAGRVNLNLLIGDVNDMLLRLEAKVDAWFLDGFSPAKNPQMWGETLFVHMQRLSSPHATFATYTSAGAVKRGLAGAGFAVEKVRGFGIKREMLRGQLDQDGARPSTQARRAIVIGGGLAGTATAASLARKGWQVLLIERHAALAAEASGNPQGVLYARLAAKPGILDELVLEGYQHSLRILPEWLPEEGGDWKRCGVLQLALDAKTAQRQAAVLARALPESLVTGVTASQAAQLAGLALPVGGLWFGQGGWVHPPALCRAFAAQDGVQTHLSTDVLHLVRKDGDWQVADASGVLACAPVVVVAAGHDATRFDQTRHLPLHQVRGQISQLPITPASAALRAVVCGEGYVSPALHGTHCLGATFNHDAVALALSAGEHTANLNMLRSMFPALFTALNASALDPETLAGRAAFRCTVRDRLPMVGAVVAEGGETVDGLFLNTAHGSRGLITAPLCAELLASQLTGEPLPVSAELARALQPGRFGRKQQ